MTNFNKCYGVITLVCLCLSINSYADTNKVSKELLNDIKQAQQTLNKTTAQINDQRTSLAAQLFKVQQQVNELHQQASSFIQSGDNDLLTLNQLQNKVEQWQQQQQYQQNQLNHFIRKYHLADNNNAAQSTGQTASQLNQIIAFSQQLKTDLQPTWQPTKVILANGAISELKTLNLGPINWFVDQEKQSAGLLNSNEANQELQVAMNFTGVAAAELLNLATNAPAGQTTTGLVTFDPSLKRMVTTATQQESIFEHVSKGGQWAIPILAFALFALVIALFKSVYLLRLPKVKMYPQQLLNSAAAATAIKGMQFKLLEIVRQQPKGQTRDDLLFNQLLNDKQQLDKWLGAIAITASVSPLLGLLGTVSGMIETFKMMTLFGSGDPEVVSGGIAQALITTELGLVVAIPALILNALLSRKAKSHYAELEGFAIQISQLDTPNNNSAETTQTNDQNTKTPLNPNDVATC